MTDITELAQMKGQKVEAPYYLAECTECGKIYPSSQLIESRNYLDGDADCYCPHCNATDPDIADCGSEGITAWNYQQARIDSLVEALEKAQQRIAELEESEKQLCAANVTLDARADLAERQLAAMDRDQVRNEHAKWSQATFGNVGPIGPLKHLSKEALEAAAEPGDLSEWADIQFLMWDAQRRAGITDEQISQAMIEKLAVNKQREWPEPKDGEPRLHIKNQRLQ